jgi:ATP-dependent Zn protease
MVAEYLCKISWILYKSSILVNFLFSSVKQYIIKSHIKKLWSIKSNLNYTMRSSSLSSKISTFFSSLIYFFMKLEFFPCLFLIILWFFFFLSSIYSSSNNFCWSKSNLYLTSLLSVISIFYAYIVTIDFLFPAQDFKNVLSYLKFLRKKFREALQSVF